MTCDCPSGMCICDLYLKGDKKSKKNYLQRQADKHIVTHEFSGKMHFFKVKSDSGEEYQIIIKLSCDCKYSAVQGIPNGKICSHILSVLRKIVVDGDIKHE